MTLVSVKEMLNKALDENYAVGHFDAHNLEWMQAILLAAEEMKSPVIIGITEDAVQYFKGYTTAIEMAKALIKDLKITVPVALHLDHGSSVEVCIGAIDAGYTSVMIDASRFTFEKNVKLTKEVVEYAHPHGVTVEAELGSIGGEEVSIISDKPIYADIEESRLLVERTNIDSLAPALGSAHGPYKGEPKVDFKKMQEISQVTNIPLVLHGASGLYPEQIQKAISSGTAKINVNADNHLRFTKAVRDSLKDEEVFDATEYLAEGRTAVKEMIIKKIKLFGSINKG